MILSDRPFVKQLTSNSYIIFHATNKTLHVSCPNDPTKNFNETFRGTRYFTIPYGCEGSAKDYNLHETNMITLNLTVALAESVWSETDVLKDQITRGSVLDQFIPEPLIHDEHLTSIVHRYNELQNSLGLLKFTPTVFGISSITLLFGIVVILVICCCAYYLKRNVMDFRRPMQEPPTSFRRYNERFEGACTDEDCPFYTKSHPNLESGPADQELIELTDKVGSLKVQERAAGVDPPFDEDMGEGLNYSPLPEPPTPPFDRFVRSRTYISDQEQETLLRNELDRMEQENLATLGRQRKASGAKKSHPHSQAATAAEILSRALTDKNHFSPPPSYLPAPSGRRRDRTPKKKKDLGYAPYIEQ